jgi:haloacetate dehalogenase
LLLHGHPETHVAWHKVAPALTDSHTVIVPDLRGYGDSSKPGYNPRSEEYSFRAMAQDMVEVMASFGVKQFMVAGHDRGGRVVHRMMLDHPNVVTKGAVLDIAPTLTMYDDTSKEFATNGFSTSNQHLLQRALVLNNSRPRLAESLMALASPAMK